MQENIRNVSYNMKIGEKIMKACGKEVYDGMRNVFFGVSKLDKLGVGATWINTKTGKHYRYDGINWIDTDALSNPSDKIICLNGDLDNLLTWDEYCEVIEYWEDDVFGVMINGHELYYGINPLPIKKKPFFAIPYNKPPGIPFGH